jgi:hypothetical protein
MSGSLALRTSGRGWQGGSIGKAPTCLASMTKGEALRLTSNTEKRRTSDRKERLWVYLLMKHR